MVFDSLVLLRREPADGSRSAVFVADAGGPRERVVDLDEVVVLFSRQLAWSWDMTKEVW